MIRFFSSIAYCTEISFLVGRNVSYVIRVGIMLVLIILIINLFVSTTSKYVFRLIK